MVEYRKLRLGKLGDNKVIDFAVRELVRYLRNIDTELVIDVLRTDELISDWNNIVWVGLHTQLDTYVPIVKDRTLDDAVAIKIENGKGFITGSNERSVLIAVYRLLRELGCDWVRPGIEGERIPQKKLDSINVLICEAASNRHRGICIEGSITYDTIEDTIDYLPKVFMNSYFIQPDVPVYYFKWRGSVSPYSEQEDVSIEAVRAMTRSLEDEIARRGLIYHKVGHGWNCNSYGMECFEWNPKEEYPIPKELKAHLAEVKGQRTWIANSPLNTNLCYSNQSARDKLTDAAVKYAKVNNHIDYLHFWLADGQMNQCECTECQKMRPADWYMILLNELDEKLTAEGLDIKVGIAATYLDLLWEPQVVRLKNPSRFALMFCPACRDDYGTNYAEADVYDKELPPYIRNQSIGRVSLLRSIEHLKQWQKGFKGDSFCFCYHMYDRHILDPGYERCARDLFDFLKSLKILKLDGLVIPQQQRCFFPTALPTYLTGEVLWNADCEFDVVIGKYYRSAFGEKAELVQNYLSCTSDLFLLYNDSGKGIVHCKDYPQLYEKIEMLKLTAENICNLNSYTYDWEIIQLHTEYLKLLAHMLEFVELEQFEKAEKCCTDLIEWITKSEVKLRKVLDGPFAKTTWMSICKWAVRSRKESNALAEANPEA